MRALHQSSTGGDAEVELAATAGKTYILQSVAYSYSGLPTTGNLLIEEISGTKLFDIDVRDSGANIIARPIQAAEGKGVKITLNGMATLKAKLVVEYDHV